MSNWEQISRWGIQKNNARSGDQNAPYAAGKLDDVLRMPVADSTIILAASAESGVWELDPDGGAARCLSLTWAHPGMNALATGTLGPLHIFAGGESLNETDTTAVNPLQSWKPIPVNDTHGVHLDIGIIHDIVVVQTQKMLVLACDKGVAFSPIPAPGGTYSFKFANIPQIRFSSITEGPNDSVFAATWRTDGPVAFNGIWVLNWIRIVASGLALNGFRTDQPAFYDTAKTIPFDQASLGRMSIASCDADRRQIYAVAANPSQGFIYCVLKSNIPPTGQITSFEVCGTLVTNSSLPFFSVNPTKWKLSGNQGDYNNCIAVSPTLSNALAIGWRDGYFVSTNGGTSWTKVPPEGSADRNYHGDYHSVRFDQFDPAQKTVYICSDGGLNITKDLGKTSSTLANRRLPNLLFTRARLSSLTSGASAGALQDNGGVSGPLYPIDGRPYRINIDLELPGNDGRSLIVLPNNRLLYSAGSAIPFPEDLIWDPVAAKYSIRPYPSSANGIVPLDQPDPQGIPAGQGVAFVEHSDGSTPRTIVGTKEAFPIMSIPTSAYKNTRGETMIAVAASSFNPPVPGTWVYGLFMLSDSNFATNPGHWTALNKVPLNSGEEICSLGTLDGRLIWVGTDKGRIFALISSPTIPWNPRDVDEISPSPLKGKIIDFAFASDVQGWAITDTNMIYRLGTNVDGGLSWSASNNPTDFNHLNSGYGGYTAVALKQTPRLPILFVSAYTDVWSSIDLGDTWTNISGVSSGLPLWPRCMDLSVVVEDSGAEYLYLATYGHSVYRLLLNSPDTTLTDVFITGEMGFTVTHLHDNKSNPLIPPQKYTLDALHPYAEFEVVNQLENLTAQLFIMMKLGKAGVVDVDFHVIFNGGQLKRQANFQLVPFKHTTEKRNAEWADGDQIDVNFAVSI
jgi:hypothetical protein